MRASYFESDDSSFFLKFIAVVAVAAILIGAGYFALAVLDRPGQNFLDPRPISASLMPGQSWEVQTDFRRVEVSSEFPVTITEAGCFVPRTVDGVVSCGPAVITITDFRPSILVWGRANRVTVTAR